MSHPTDETSEPAPLLDRDEPRTITPVESPGAVEVEELTPDGGRLPVVGDDRTPHPSPSGIDPTAEAAAPERVVAQHPHDRRREGVGRVGEQDVLAVFRREPLGPDGR